LAGLKDLKIMSHKFVSSEVKTFVDSQKMILVLDVPISSRNHL